MGAAAAGNTMLPPVNTNPLPPKSVITATFGLCVPSTTINSGVWAGVKVTFVPSIIPVGISATTETPGTPCAPVGPVAPTSPRGITKFKIAAEVVPTFVTLASVPGNPVVVTPASTVAAAPVSPFRDNFVAFLVVPEAASTNGITSVSRGVPSVSSDIFWSAILRFYFFSVHRCNVAAA